MTAEDFFGMIFLFLFYCLFGMIVGGVMDMAGHMEPTWGNIATVILLWPLFLIKYLLIAIWFILSNGYTMLLGF